MRTARHSLRRRIVAAFIVFALLASLCFSAFSLLFVYTVEDSFFDNLLRQEQAHQAAGGGEPVTPLRSFVSVHRSPATFPADLAPQFAAAGRAGGEFAGQQGRHYHVRGPTPPAPFYLVAEVSRELVVRPRVPFIAGVLAALAFGLTAVTALAGYLLARSATAPLGRLARLVSSADPAVLPRRFAHEFPDNEIGAVAARLEQAMRRIAEFIEREQRFAQDASHELRTPVAVVDGAARLLATQPLPPKAREQVRRIAAAADGMGRTVDTLLALAREELGQAPRQEVRLLPLVEELVVRHAHLLAGKDIDVVLDVDPGAVLVCHAAALEILLSNLVSNAFGHSGSGRIRIASGASAIVVEDGGPGIDPAVRGRLFEAGTRGADSSGHGLGLSIAHRLAARSGFALEFHSRPGTGTCAVLRCP